MPFIYLGLIALRAAYSDSSATSHHIASTDGQQVILEVNLFGVGLVSVMLGAFGRTVPYQGRQRRHRGIRRSQSPCWSRYRRRAGASPPLTGRRDVCGHATGG
jgi:hypothetical protein